MEKKDSAVNLGERFLGDYYCYYLSDHYIGEIHGGIMRVHRSGGAFRVQLINSLQEDSQFHDPQLWQVLQEGLTLAESRHRFLQYRNGLKNTGLKRCFYCEGVLRAYERSVIMELTNVNNPSHLMILTLNIQQRSVHSRYRGGIAVFLSPSTGLLETRVGLMGLSRHCFSLQDEEISPYLEIHEQKTHRVELTSADDRKWYNLLLKRENEPPAK